MSSSRFCMRVRSEDAATVLLDEFRSKKKTMTPLGCIHYVTIQWLNLPCLLDAVKARPNGGRIYLEVDSIQAVRPSLKVPTLPDVWQYAKLGQTANCGHLAWMHSQPTGNTRY